MEELLAPTSEQSAIAVLLIAGGPSLQLAPSDPVLKQYYQSAATAREATIQQLGRTLPAGVRLANY